MEEVMEGVREDNRCLTCTCILSHHPAKYRKVSIENPMWVLRARVYTAPESTLSSVASSSLCCSTRSASLK